MSAAMFLYVYDWSVIPKSMKELQLGLELTLQIAVVSLGFSLVVGLIVALCRLSRFPPLSILAYAYTQLFRALSLYVYILWVYFGVPAFLGIYISPFQSAVVCLTLLNSAYMSEIYRAAITSIDLGQWEASRSLGMNPVTSFFSVILPQAWRVAVPSLVNQFVDIIKDTSIVALIGAGELMYRTTVLVSFYNRPFEFYTTVGAIYLVVVVVVAQLANLLERRLRLPAS
jgi:His/Glu/Gln/Arg/opine family amino acid ABC transporter permease subunit